MYGTCTVLPGQWHQQCEAESRKKKVSVQQKWFVMMAVTHLRHRKVTVSVLPCLLEQLGQIWMRLASLSLTQGSVFRFYGTSWLSFSSQQCSEWFFGVFCCYIASLFLCQPETMGQYETDQEASWGMKGTLQYHFHSPLCFLPLKMFINILP